MTRVFVDTSAFYSLLDREDANHAAARPIWTQLLADNSNLISTNYILIETFALVQNRLGMNAVTDFQQNVAPILSIEWVDAGLHRAGVEMLLVANRRKLSLVDCISFATCRQLGIDRVFAFDQHFVEQGFTLLGIDAL